MLNAECYFYFRFFLTAFTGCSPGASTRFTMGVLSLYFLSNVLPLSSLTRITNTGKRAFFVEILLRQGHRQHAI